MMSDPVYLTTKLTLLTKDSYDAAEFWAKNSITNHPGVAWMVGKFVEADNPTLNNQMWTVKDLADSHQTVRQMPLNYLHDRNSIIGFIADSRMIYPTSDDTPPFVEVVAGMWRFLEPDLYDKIKTFHDQGELFFSMECVGETVTFVNKETGEEVATFDYDGPTSPSYGGLQMDENLVRRINNPLFLGGAVIIPPEVPAVQSATIWDVSQHNCNDCDKSLIKNDSETISNNVEVSSLNHNEGGDEVGTEVAEKDFEKVVSELDAAKDEIASLKRQLEHDEIAAEIASLKEDYEKQLESLRKDLDEAVLKAETATQALEDARVFAEAEAAAWEEAAEVAKRRDERISRVKEVASFPEEYLDANADRWASMTDPDFEAAVADYAAIPKAVVSKEKEESVPEQTALNSEREVASAGSAIGSVLRFRIKGIDPRAV